MNTMKLRSNFDWSGTIKNTYHSTTASRSDAQMLVANLRHVQMIPVVIQHRNMFGKQEVYFYATIPNHVSLKFNGSGTKGHYSNTTTLAGYIYL